MSEKLTARQYDQAYHDHFYTNNELGQPNSEWLSRPSKYALAALKRVQPSPNARALDLGGGVGRHAIPIAQHLGEGAQVTCVELNQIALEKLAINARERGVAERIMGVHSDVIDFSLEGEYDAIFSVSCIEHVPDKLQLTQLIKDLQAHTTENGVHCFMMMTDNQWVSESGEQKAPLLEQNLSSRETALMLITLYENWRVNDLSMIQWHAPQKRYQEDGTLINTCLRFTAVK